MAEEFAEDYALALQQLTFNSKPVITSLTMIASESQFAASEITRVIEDRLTDVSLPDRLPTLYLMDSILKNVGGVYIQEFAKNLYKTFTFIFEEADAARKQKLERLLTTWKEIFDEPLLFSIRKYVTESKVGLHTKPVSVQPSAETAPLNILDSIQQVQEMLMSPEQRQLLKTLQQRKTQQPANFAINSLLTLVQSKPLPAEQVAAIGGQVQALSQTSTGNMALQDIYENLRLVCKQCGMRYSDMHSDSKSKFQEHMDWHFRQNKKMADKTLSTSREWFAGEAQWILPESDEIEQEASFQQKQVQQVQEQLVPYIEEQGKTCGICNEVFETVWDDSIENWMLRDAVRKDDKVYHASCYELAQSPAEEEPKKKRKVKK